MKKVLSLLLVCVMLLSFALVANAAGEGYTLNYYDLELVSTKQPPNKWIYSIGYLGEDSDATPSKVLLYDKTYENTTNVDGFALEIAANMGASSGLVAIDYDETVVCPAHLEADGELGIWGQAVTDMDTDTYTPDSAVIPASGNLSSETPIVDGDGLAFVWSYNGDLPANTPIAYIHFVYVNGKSEADLNADSIKFAVVDSVKAAASNAARGNMETYGAAMAVFENAAHGIVDASNENRSYPNVSEGLEPEVDAVGATETEINAIQDWTAGEFKYPTDTAGSTDTAAVGKKVAAFGKANVALEAEKYGVKIGNRYYPGKWDVPADSLFAIIVVNTDGDAAIKGSYTYSIYTGNAESNPTIIVENLPAVVK